jgi:hypothetical protein
MALQIKGTTAQQRHRFTELIVSILDIIDDNMNQALNDGDYLTICNNLKYLFAYKKLICADGVFQHLDRARRQNRNVPVRPSLLDKSISEDYTNCCKCNRFIKKTQLEDHLKRPVCIQSVEAKHTTLIKQSKETSLHPKTQVLARALLTVMSSEEKWQQQQAELEAEDI